jgi:hypothetical protein
LESYGALFGFEGSLPGQRPDIARALNGLAAWHYGSVVGSDVLVGLHTLNADDRVAYVTVVVDPRVGRECFEMVAALCREWAELFRLRKVCWEFPLVQALADGTQLDEFVVEGCLPARRYHRGRYFDVLLLALFAEDEDASSGV